MSNATVRNKGFNMGEKCIQDQLTKYVPCYSQLFQGWAGNLALSVSNKKKNNHFQSCRTAIKFKTSQLPRKSQTFPATGACKKCVLIKKHCDEANYILNYISKFNRGQWLWWLQTDWARRNDTKQLMLLKFLGT